MGQLLKGTHCNETTIMPEYNYTSFQIDDDNHQSEDQRDEGEEALNNNYHLHANSNQSQTTAIKNEVENENGASNKNHNLHVHVNDHHEQHETKTISSSTQKMEHNNALQRKWSLFLYSITTILLFADQNLLAPNLSSAAEEFGFNDEQRDQKLGGDIALAFFVLGAPASFAVGCLADSDRISRNFLFGFIVLIGEGACFLTYFTSTYSGLYWTRALTGFSVGGALPLLSSVLGDWYRPSERGAVMASVGIGTGIGISLGQGISGILGPVYGWRVPFLVVSVPALVVAVLLMTTVVDPARGGSEREHQHQHEQECDIESERERDNGDRDTSASTYTSTCSSASSLASAPASMPMVLSSPLVARSKSFEADNQIQSGLDPLYSQLEDEGNEHGHASEQEEVYDNEKFRDRKQRAYGCGFKLSTCMNSQHVQTSRELLKSKTVLLTLIQGAPGCIPWGIVNTFLNDYLSQDCGMSVQTATATILVFGVGNFLGILVGGIGGDYLHKRDVRYPALLSGIMAILGCVPLWVLINTTSVDEGRGMTIWAIVRTGITSLLAGFGSGVTGPIVKATLQNVTLPNARGQAFALLNTFDDFGRGLGPVFVASLIVALGGRRIAFNVGVGGWILCGLLNSCIFFTIREDVFRSRKSFMDQYTNLSQCSSSLDEPETSSDDCNVKGGVL